MSQMPLPKYHQIYLVLREQLHEGRFAEGLPGELALMAQFGVARVTVRRALEQLSSEGLIARNPGRRTRALPPAGCRRTAGRRRAWSAPICAACSRTWSPWACTPR
jgi:GntR family transcriptional regulator